MGKKDIKTHEEQIKYIEERMGMPVKKFHEKLDELLTPEYIFKAKEYQDFLNKWLEAGLPIYDRDNKQELLLKDDEKFEQVFNPELPYRNELPRTWFFSNFGNLISVYDDIITNTTKVLYLPPSEYNNVRGTHGFIHPITKANRTIRHHNLIIIMTQKNVSEKFLKTLELYGTYAFAPDSTYTELLNGHHNANVAKYPEKRYSSDNLSGISTACHELMRDSKKTTTDDLDEIQYMLDIAKTMEQEEPGQPICIMTGKTFDKEGNYIGDDKTYCPSGVKSIMLSEQTFNLLNTIMKLIN